MTTPIVYIKVSKTGSQVILKGLLQKLIDKHGWSWKYHPPHWDMNIPFHIAFMRKEFMDKDVIIGHYSPRPFQWHRFIYAACLRKSPIFLGSVREPMKCHISNYYYGNRFKDNMTWEEWYTKYSVMKNDQYSLYGYTAVVDFMHNHLSNYLGFTDINEITEETVKDRYFWIFRLENFRESVYGFIEKFGMDVEPDLTPDNVNKVVKRGINNLKQETIDLFKKNNEMDYKLYDIVKNLYK